MAKKEIKPPCPTCSDGKLWFAWCYECGRPLNADCGNCRHVVSADYKYCPNCGADLKLLAAHTKRIL